MVFKFCVVFFLYGIFIGSLLNVLIIRVLEKERKLFAPSICMSCKTKLKWYEMIPIISYIILGGKCRHCKEKISLQYPLVEFLNGSLYVLLYLVKGVTVETFLYCLCTSALICISVIDWRTYEIPVGFNIFILFLGLIRLVTDLGNWSQYVIGLFAVSGFLYLLLIVTNGRGIGGGDVKLMAATGLLLGWQLNVVALMMGCILGSVIHLSIMAIKKTDKVLAFGPYLSAGVFIAMIWGEQLVSWYLGIVGIWS